MPLQQKERRGQCYEAEEEFILLMVITDEHEEFLLQGIPQHSLARSV